MCGWGRERPTGEEEAEMGDDGLGPRLTENRLQLNREEGGSNDVLGCREGPGCNLGRWRCNPRKTAQKSWFGPDLGCWMDAVGCRPNGICNWREARSREGIVGRWGPKAKLIII